MKKTPYMFIIFLLFGGSVNAQDNHVIKEVKVYKTIDGTPLKAHMFYTAETQKNRHNPAIGFFHRADYIIKSGKCPINNAPISMSKDLRNSKAFF